MAVMPVRRFAQKKPLILKEISLSLMQLFVLSVMELKAQNVLLFALSQVQSFTQQGNDKGQ